MANKLKAATRKVYVGAWIDPELRDELRERCHGKGEKMGFFTEEAIKEKLKREKQ